MTKHPIALHLGQQECKKLFTIALNQGFWIYRVLILQDKTLFCALEAGDIVCWLVNQPTTKLDLLKSPDCRWICKTYAAYAGYCYRNSATVRRLTKSNFAIDIFCGVHSDLRGKSIRVSPAWFNVHITLECLVFPIQSSSSSVSPKNDANKKEYMWNSTRG